MVVPLILTARLVIRTSKSKFPVVMLLVFCPCLTDPFSNARTGNGADTKGKVWSSPKGESDESDDDDDDDDPEIAQYGLFF